MERMSLSLREGKWQRRLKGEYGQWQMCDCINNVMYVVHEHSNQFLTVNRLHWKIIYNVQ